jgi:hypothetical protein
MVTRLPVKEKDLGSNPSLTAILDLQGILIKAPHFTT